MTVTVANTNLNNSFNSWRLNTNLLATVMSNNVVTVMRDKTGQGRGGSVTGNAHISGTFSATTLRTGTLRSGNTTDAGGWLYVNSNTSINATSLAIVANTTIAGNVIISTTGSQIFNVGDVSRLRIGGGSTGQYLRKGALGKLDFEYLTLRQITDLSSNSAHLILSAANTTFSDNGDSPHLRFSGLADKIDVFLAADGTPGDSDLYIKLVDAGGDSTFVIADSANNRVAYIDSDGNITAAAAQFNAVTANGHVLPGADDTYDLGSSGAQWRNLYIDGTGSIDTLTVGTGGSQGVTSSLIPVTDAAGSLGSTTRKWSTVWADTTNGGAGVFNTLGVSSTLNANGNATIGGTLGVTGAATFNGNMTLGDTDADTITVKGKFANLAVTGVASFNGTTYMNGALYLNGNVYVGNQLTDTLQVTANTNLTGDVVIGDTSADVLTINSQIDSNLIPVVDNGTGHYTLGSTGDRWNGVYANTMYANNIFVDNDVTVAGDVTVDGNINLSGGAAVTAPSGSFTTLTVTGTSNLNGTVNLGDASGDNINVNGSINTDVIPVAGERHNLGSSGSKWSTVYANNVTVGDEMTVTNRVSITKNLQVSGNTNIDGNITADGTWRNDSTVIIGSNAKLHANNTITAGTITNAMLANSKLTFRDGASGNTTLVDLGDTVSIYEGEGIDVFVNSDSISIHGEDATTSNKGIASFNSNNFVLSSGFVSLKDAGVASSKLINTGVSAASYGSATAVPVITVNSKGQITSATTATVAGVNGLTYTQSNNNIRISTATGKTYDDVIDPATTTSGTGRGVASFDSGDFTVSSGHVTLKDASTGAVLAINGTSNEVNVSRTNGTVTVGLPDDVTITGQLSVGENIVVSGNLIVQGTTTTVNSETVNIADNKIVLNSNYAGSTPTEDAGIVIERGTKANYEFIWDESDKRWSTVGRNLAANNFVGNLTGNVTGSADTLTTARSIGISLSGDVTGSGSASFDGSGNITISATNLAIQPDSVVLGTDTTGNYVATIADSAGIDISGSGSEGAAVTVSLDLSELTTSTSDGDGDYFIVTDTSGAQKKLTKGNINISGFNNDAGYSTTTGTVTSMTVTAGDGLSGGGTVTSSGSVTLNVGAGAGIDVAADTISVESDLRGDVQYIGQDTNDYYYVGTTAHDWYLDGNLDMRLENDGDLHVDGSVVAYSGTTSDERLKTNISVVENALEKVCSLRGVEFDYTIDNKRSAGLIAQEVEKVLPQAVSEKKLPTKTDDDLEYKVLEYAQINALLVEAIKELKAEIDELKKNK